MAILKYKFVKVNGNRYKALKGYGTLVRTPGEKIEAALVSNTMAGLRKAYERMGPFLRSFNKEMVTPVIILKPHKNEDK